ncbi:hypothetical protein LSH36_178g03009 [Paralvinella palmiformis]|uniref:Uncharacterized protein n=1 Tax=Paralvinella palmiformis TaxID=53620 RepID=A0AAD9JRS7_9ANNE|nr:hypothetical protein LSH36_178g03009 [Paralvinella palmiformis]
MARPRIIYNAWGEEEVFLEEDIDHSHLVEEALAALTLTPESPPNKDILKTFLALSSDSRTLHKDHSIRENSHSVKNYSSKCAKTLPRSHKVSACSDLLNEVPSPLHLKHYSDVSLYVCV